MKQIITRVDEHLARALKEQAARAGESVNSYVTRMLRTVTASSPASAGRSMWKATALADGRLARRGLHRKAVADLPLAVRTPAGYAADLVARDREDR